MTNQKFKETGVENRKAGTVLTAVLLMTLYGGFLQTAQSQNNKSQVEAFELVPLDHSKPAEPNTPQLPNDPILQIASFEVRYASPDPDHPALEEISMIELILGQEDGRYTSPEKGETPLRLHLADLPEFGMQRFHHSAIQAINSQIVSYLNRQGLVGVVVTPDRADIGVDGADLRISTSQPLRLVIHTARVKRLRTLATRFRFPGQERINQPAHRRILEHSPLRPADGAPGNTTNLLRKDLLDNYLFRLNRQPGRRVDVAILPGDEPDAVFLDYLIVEKKPWSLYFQGSNTGTENTKDWRWHMGFVNNQLFNNDDILSLDYITTDFTSPESKGALISYEAPLFDSDTMRWSLYSSLGKFTSSDVSRRDEDFSGETYKVGAELYLNVFQQRELFADLLAGARWEDLEVKNKTIQLTGREQLFFPYLGLRLERFNERASTQGRLILEWTESGVTDPDKKELTELGRLGPSKNWYALKLDFSHAFFLEPLFDRKSWYDVTTPKSSTLAHEVMVNLRGQYTFDRRVIPQHEGLVGGAYSVRGYTTAIASGDSTITSTLEYRFHLPRTLNIEPDPHRTPLFGRSFRFAPQQVFGRPDWDLIFRAFIDAGRTNYADRLVIEKNETLIGTGLGLELTFKDNLSLRADWGVALRTVREDTRDEVEPGDSELHVTFTILY